MRRFVQLGILLGHLLSIGCFGSSHGNDQTFWLSYRPAKTDSTLTVSKDCSYEFLMPSKSSAKRGSFDQATCAQLATLFDIEHIRHYVDVSLSSGVTGERCLLEGTEMYFHVIGAGCWVREDLTDASTAAMLDYVGALVGSIPQD